MTRRTIEQEIMQPAANALREVARHLEDECATCDDGALRQLARDLGEPEGPELRRRMAHRICDLADLVERGEL